MATIKKAQTGVKKGYYKLYDDYAAPGARKREAETIKSLMKKDTSKPKVAPKPAPKPAPKKKDDGPSWLPKIAFPLGRNGIKKGQAGLKASNKRVGPVDPRGAWTKVQEQTLRGKRTPVSLTRDKQLGATSMTAKKGIKVAKGGKWIQKAIKKPGALRAQLGAKPGKPIPAGKLAKAAKAKGKLGQRARLAQTLKKMRKK